MKLACFFLAAAFTGAYASGNSQSVTLSGKDLPLKAVFTSIKKQTGFVVFGNGSLFFNTNPVSVRANNMPLHDFLNTVLEYQPLSYAIEGKTIVISSLSRIVTLSFKNAPIASVLEEISGQTGYHFLYDDELIKNSKPVTIESSKASLENVLSLLFKNRPLTYAIDRKFIILKNKEEEIQPSGLANSASLIEVKGTVTNEKGELLEGVSVTEKGAKNGTTTNKDGAFSISVRNESAVLVFEYIGYAAKEIKASSTGLNIVLTEMFTNMNEVVVMGYSSRKQSELSSSVSVVSGKKLRDVTSNNVADLLQGKAPGVVVSSSSGDPNANPSIVIRGSSSITAGSEPLYVVDGIIGGTANPNDIESITILRDAAATGLYGSRASNGVIIITTKRGRSGKTQVNVSSTLGINRVTEGNYRVMNSQQLYDYQKTFWDPNTFDRDRPDSLLSQNTNWQDLMFNTGVVQNHTITISGGSEKTQMYVSGNYYKEEGTLGPTGNEAFNIRSNISHKINEKLKLSVRLNARARNMENEAAGSNFLTTHENMPWDNPYNPDGSFKRGTEEEWIGRDNDNFLHGWSYNFDKTRQSSLNGDITLDYNITKGLTFSSNNRASYSNEKRELYYDIRAKAGLGDGRLTNDFRSSTQFITSNRLLYEKSFDKHNFNAIAVAEAEKNYADFNSLTGAGLAPGLHVMDAASSILMGTSTTGENAFSKGLVQLDYAFDNRYFIVGSVIRESSSRFGANNRAANFFTLGGSWILSNEHFMDNQDRFDLLKVRASYGLTGNAQIGNYQTLGLYSFSTQYGGNSGAFPSQLANNNLTWEKAETVNFGFDIGLFKRISLNVDLYQKLTNALLLNVQLPYTTGFSSVIQNVGSVRNRGIEINLNTVNLDREFKWETNFNIAFNRNRVLVLDEGKDILEVGASSPTRIISVGHDLNSWYMRKWAGVDPANGDPLWEKITTDANGQKTMATTNIYSDASLQFVGTFTPKFTGGINNVFTYKAFSLSAFFNFISGIQVYSSSAFITDSDGAYDTENQRVLQKGETRWQQPGDIATQPKPVFGGNLSSNRVSSRYLQDGSYIRLRNVKFTYELPGSFLDRMKIAGASVFISGDNLWTGTSFIGKDPQAALSRTGGEIGDYPTGGEVGNYPISKRILLGINIGL